MTSPTLAYNLTVRLRKIRLLRNKRVALDRVIAQEIEELERVCRQNGENPNEWLSRVGIG